MRDTWATSRRCRCRRPAAVQYRTNCRRPAPYAIVLTAEEIAYLEAPYVPHNLVGVMAQNTPSAAKEAHVWSTGNQKIKA